MPKNSPNAQTVATERYRKKKGIVSKSFNLERGLIDEFAAACQKAGESQLSVIKRAMLNYIAEQNGDTGAK